MKKVKVQIVEGVDPGLFGQKHSSRDYRYEDAWGKNQFNKTLSLVMDKNYCDLKDVSMHTL